WASRNMAVLGTLILIFIALHMSHFWAKMHYTQMPLQKVSIATDYGTQDLYVTTAGSYIGTSQIDNGQIEIKNKTEFFDVRPGLNIAEGYTDQYNITIDFHNDDIAGLWYTIYYVFSLAVLAFHRNHGLDGAFQSVGLHRHNYNQIMK